MPSMPVQLGAVTADVDRPACIAIAITMRVVLTTSVAT